MVGFIDPYWDSVLTSAGIAAIIAAGVYFSNSAGALSAAHAAIAGMAGYTGAVLTTKFSWPFAAALLVGGAVGLVTGGILAAVSLRMNPLVAGLTTLAVGQTIVVIAYNIDYIGGASSFYGIPPDTTLRGVFIVVALVLFLGWRFDTSRLGLAARACRDDEVAANASGINVAWVKIAVFALGGGVAGIGGVMYAHFVLVENPENLGFANSLNYLIIWVFGGSYIFLGPVVGALILTILPELLRFSADERYMLYGLLLTVVVILRPSGLIPRISLKRPARVERRRWGIRRANEAEVDDRIGA